MSNFTCNGFLLINLHSFCWIVFLLSCYDLIIIFRLHYVHAALEEFSCLLVDLSVVINNNLSNKC